MNPQAEMFLRMLGVSGADVQVALDSPTETTAIRHIAEFTAHPERRMLLLSGATGSGKTIAAVRWLAGLHGYGKAGDDLDSPAGWEWLRARTAYARSFDLGRMNLRYRDADRDAFDRLKAARWLVLDDLGVEPADSISLVEELIDARSRFGWTVITTNLPCGPKFDSSPFSQRYGARIGDRIAGNGRICGCGDANFRRGGT